MENLVSNVVTSESILTNDGEESILNYDKLSTDTRFLANPYVSLTPLEPVTADQTTYNFIIRNNEALNYTLLSEIYCCAKVSLVKQKDGEENWTPVEVSDNCLVASYLTDVMWSKVEVFLNQTRISSTNTFRFLSACLAKRIFFQKRANETYLDTELADLDLNKDPDDTFSEDNEQLKKRRDLFVKTNQNTAPEVTIIGLLTHDLSTLTEPIPDKCEIVIQLQRNSNERLIQIGPSTKAQVGTWEKPAYKYRLRLHNLCLLIRRPLLSESAYKIQSRRLQNKPARYHFMKLEMCWQNLPLGKQIYNSPELFANYKYVFKHKIFGQVLNSCFFYSGPTPLKFMYFSMKIKDSKEVIPKVSIILHNLKILIASL